MKFFGFGWLVFLLEKVEKKYLIFVCKTWFEPDNKIYRIL